MSHSKKAEEQRKIKQEAVLPEPGGKPANLRLQKLILPAITFVVAIAGYLLTFARTVTLVDSGDLILTSATSGVAHPPGFPLYTLLGHIFTKLPFGSVAARVSFMSALFAALASAIISLIAVEMNSALGEYRTRQESGKTRAKN